ncbi:MAG: tRNA-guanine transglycosylase [Blastocatellia bacterium]
MRNGSFGKHILPTPAVFASYRIADFPRAGLRFHPWEITQTKAVLLNAYDLIANTRTRKYTNEIRERKQTLGEHIEFHGPVMLDSGAYNFLQHEVITIKPNDVLDIALEFNANVCVVLDHPFPPHASADEIAVRLKHTQTNTRAMFERLKQKKQTAENIQLMPVLHGHDAKTLERSLRNIRSTIGQDPSIVGIGSLAPLAQNGSKRTVVDIIRTVRELLPEAHIHCFSMGSALLMLLAFYCGADTVDSQTWIMSAAFKQVQLPGCYLTRLSQKEAQINPKYKLLRLRFAQQLTYLCTNEDFTVRNWDTGEIWRISSEREALKYLDFLIDRDGVNHVHRRACHNLYAFNFEARKVRQIMSCSRLELEEFIFSRLHSTLYRQVFEYAMMKDIKNS